MLKETKENKFGIMQSKRPKREPHLPRRLGTSKIREETLKLSGNVWRWRRSHISQELKREIYRTEPMQIASEPIRGHSRTDLFGAVCNFPDAVTVHITLSHLLPSPY